MIARDPATMFSGSLDFRRVHRVHDAQVRGDGELLRGTGRERASRRSRMADVLQRDDGERFLRFRTWYNIETELRLRLRRGERRTAGTRGRRSRGTSRRPPTRTGTTAGTGSRGQAAGGSSRSSRSPRTWGRDRDPLQLRDRSAHLGEGFYVDVLGPVPTCEAITMAASALPDTFLTMTPEEEGTFAYRVRARDAENQKSGGASRGASRSRTGPGSATRRFSRRGSGRTTRTRSIR